ncbi:MAG: OmpA family protein [Pyrinomonadaceae bacterium]
MNKLNAIFLIIFLCFGCKLFSGESNNNSSPETNVVPTEQETAPPEVEGASSKDALKDKTDLLSIGAGVLLENASSEYTPGELARWSAYGLIDESKKTGWAGAKDQITNQTVVFKLPAKTTLKTIGFDTAETDQDAAAKNVKIEVSITSANEGFEPILETELKNAEDNQNFNVTKEVPAKFLRLTAADNYGSKEWLEIIEVRGYGSQEALTPMKTDVSGTYETENYGKFHIKQEGTSIVGCYEFDGGLLEGGLNGRIMTLTWKENPYESDGDVGPAVFNFDEDGKNFTGFWTFASNEYYQGKWDGKKISDEVGSCEHFKALSEDNAAGSLIEKELEKDGRAAVYGINFDFNSDVIKPESQSTLDQIVTVLNDNPSWNMTIEGHTDSIGGEKFNQSLSEKRAVSVKNYLTTKGIAASRLETKGLGLSAPVATNDTEAGRARNRRVELVKN